MWFNVVKNMDVSVAMIVAALFPGDMVETNQVMAFIIVSEGRAQELRQE